jgi:peptidyl-prolyl cis-trans isomerase A (cyclophilin A)
MENKQLRISIILFISVLIFLFSCQHNNPRVKIETELGTINVELYPEKAPVTVNNFIRYINEGRLNEATFYRTVTKDNQPDNDVKIEVIQGGLFEDNHPNFLPPIKHEATNVTGILHKDGVISMARNEPGTATCEFFICLGDQPSLDYGGMRNPDGQGFAAFGKVIDGMDVVRKIHQAHADGQWLDPRIQIKSIRVIN